jgi:hypothetical protein
VIVRLGSAAKTRRHGSPVEASQLTGWPGRCANALPKRSCSRKKL